MSKSYAIFLGSLYALGGVFVYLLGHFALKKPSAFDSDDWIVTAVTVGGNVALTLFAFLTNPAKRKEILGGQSDTDFIRDNPNGDQQRLPEK